MYSIIKHDCNTNYGRESINYLFEDFLRYPFEKEYVGTRQQGTTVMNISYKGLNNIGIPFNYIEKQQSIADEYTKELKFYKRIIKEAENRWLAMLSKLQGRI